MSEIMLFRAPPEFGAFNTWAESHFESIGKVEVVAAAIRALFARTPLRWSRYDESGWIFAEGKDDGGHVIDLMFRAAAHGGVDHVIARNADGVILVKLVEMLELNFAFDPVKGKYVDPYRCDAAGQSLVAKGVCELTARSATGFKP